MDSKQRQARLAAEATKVLEKWAMRNSKKYSLLPGEHIIFSVRIENRPIAEEEKEEEGLSKVRIHFKRIHNRAYEPLHPVQFTQDELKDFLQFFEGYSREFLEFMLVKYRNIPVDKRGRDAQTRQLPEAQQRELYDKFYSGQLDAEKFLQQLEWRKKHFRIIAGIGPHLGHIQLWEVKPKE